MEIFQELFYQGFNILELAAVVTAFLYVWLNIRQNIWCWPIGLVSVAAYLVVFYQVRLYADMGLQGVYILLFAYGWYYWLRGGDAHAEAKVIHLSPKLVAMLTALGVVATVAMGYGLSHYTNADLPYWDSTTTVMSLLAQWMTSRKILENWLVWLAADILYVGIFIYKGLYMTSGLYAVYLVLAIIGYRAWKKTMAT